MISLKTERKLLQVKQLTKSYRKQLIFDQVTFDLAQGEWLGLVGENGSGKSTLVKIIAGLEKAAQGEVLFNKRDQTTFSRGEWAQSVQLITQYTRRALDPTKTIAKILAEPLHQWKILPEHLIPNKLEQMMDEYNLPLEMLAKYPLELSGGQYQRVCIALSLLAEPQVLICDEITASLDKINEKRIFNLLKQRTNLSVIMIAHDTSLIERLCDRRLKISDYK